jgi:hypothetical protein
LTSSFANAVPRKKNDVINKNMIIFFIINLLI